MANSNRNIQFSLSCNAEQPKKQIEALKKLEEDLLERRKQLIAAGQTEGKSWDMVKGALRDTRKEIRNAEDNYETLRKVITDLANSSMPQLKKAFKEGQKAISNMSENSEDLKAIQQAMKDIQGQMDIVAGKAKNIAKGMDDLENRTDGWITAAKKQVRDYADSLDDIDDEYKRQLELLKRLEAEEKRRAEAKSLTKEQAQYRLNNVGQFKESEVKEAIAVMKKLRDETELGDEEWDNYAKSIARAEKKMQELKDYYKYMSEERAMDVAKNPERNREEYVRQAIDSLKELQKHTDVGSERWLEYQRTVESAEKALADLKNTKEKMSANTALDIASKGKYTDNQGNEHLASLNQMQESKKMITEARNASQDADAIKLYNQYLAQLEERIQAVNGKVKESSKISSAAAQSVREVLRNPTAAKSSDITNTIELLNKRLADLPQNSKGAIVLKRRIEELQKVINGTTVSQEKLDDILSRSKQGKASISELKQAYKQLEEQLQHIEDTSGKTFKDKHRDMQNLKKHIDDVTGAANKQSSSWKTALHNLTAYVGMFTVFNQVKSLLTGVIKKNYDYSASLTDIRKVAGLAEEDIKSLSKQLSKIDTRTTTEGLAKLAYGGAKLGMSKYGIEGMAAFVRAADQINVAIGEEMGEEALPALSKMVEVMGLIPKMGIERSLLATGSAMFKLSTTSTATSGNITEFAKRCTGVARQAGLTTDQLLALGSAFDSQMASPEVAATAMSKFIVALQKNHNLIAEDLGIQDEVIKKYYEEGRAMDAIVLILEKMKEKGNMNALGDIFKDMGGDGQRLISAMVTMSKNVNMLKDHLDTASEAFEEASAVTAEYEMQQQSAIGILERANNLWEKAFVNPEGVDNVKELANAWYEVSQFLVENAAAMGSMKLTFDAIILSCKTLVYILPSLMAGLLFKGASAAAIGIKHALLGMGESAVIATLKTEGLNAAWKKLNASMKANWISVAIGLFVELGVLIYENFIKTEKLAEAQNDMNDYIERGAAAWDKEKRKIDSYIAALDDANTSTDQRQRLVKKFNKEYNSYLEKLNIEVKSVDDLRGAYEDLNAEIRKKMYWQIREEAYDEKLGKERGNVQKATIDYSKYINSDKGVESGWSAFDTKWLQSQVNEGRDAEQIYRNMVESVYGKGGTWSGYDNSYITNGGKGSSVKDDTLKGYIANFVKAGKGYNTTKKEIDDALNPLIGDYDPYKQELPGDLDNDANRKGRGSSNSEKKEEQIAKDRANALIANIKAFYEEQQRKYIQWVTEQNANGEVISEGMQKEKLAYLESQMNTALGKARQSIATLDDEWKKFYEHIDEDVIVFDDETSKQIIESMGKADIEGLNKLFTKLSGDLSKENNRTLSENLGALLDQIFANGSKELRQAAEMLLARQREIQKILNDYDLTGAVNRTTRSNFDALGFLKPAAGVRDDSQEGLQKMNSAFDALTKKARECVADLYAIDPESEQFQDKFLSFISIANSGFDFASLKAEQLKALYIELLKYYSQYTEAEKNTDDRRRKVNDYGWSQTDTYKDYNKATPAQEQKTAVLGSYRNAGQKFGMSDIVSNDPELEMMKMRMEFAQKYYDFLEKHHASEKDLAEARKSIMQSQAEYAKKLTSDMFEQYNALLGFTEPLQTFGASVGEAFGTMREDAAAGKKAIRDAVKQMVKSFATNTLNIISQQQIEQAQTTAHYAALLAMQTAFGQAKIQQESASGQAMLATQQANNTASVNLEAIKEQQKMALRSAGIFGWCVSELGPIAGPIAYSAMMSTLMGLLNYALSFIGSSSSSAADGAKTNTKLVSGMLTYDSGNVQDLKPFFDKDGNMYWATEDDSDHRGVSLLTQPTATTINGQPSLVAEKGPELVIGRETTAAMMQNNPQLLRALYAYDRNHSGRQAYDKGNIASVASTTTATSLSGDQSPDNTANIALIQAVNALLTRLNEPIKASINMYGRDGLYESNKKATAFMRNR